MVYMFASVGGDFTDLQRLPAYWVDTLDEATALALLRANWPATLRLAAALLAAPDGRLTWDEQVTLAGTVVEADDDTVCQIRDALEAGELDSLVARVTHTP